MTTTHLGQPRTDVRRGIFFASLVDSVGTGMYATAGVIFFARRLHLTGAEIGLGISIGALVALVAALIIARVADRLGVGITLVVLQLVSAAGYAGFLLVHDFATFVLIACVVSAADRGWQPLAATVVTAASAADSRAHGLATLRVIRNVGFGVGGLLTAGALAVSGDDALPLLVAANAATFLVSVVVLLVVGVAGQKTRDVLTRVRREHAPQSGADGVQRFLWSQRLPYIKVAALDGVATLHMSVLTIGIPLVIARGSIDEWWMSVIYVGNTIGVVLLQRKVTARLSGSLRTGRRTMVAGMFLLASTCACLAAAVSARDDVVYVLLAALAVLVTAAELAQATASWTMATGLAPHQGSAQVYATFDLGFNAQLVVGPVLIGAVATYGSSAWLALGVCIAAVGLVTGRLVTSAARRLGAVVA